MSSNLVSLQKKSSSKHNRLFSGPYNLLNQGFNNSERNTPQLSSDITIPINHVNQTLSHRQASISNSMLSPTYAASTSSTPTGLGPDILLNRRVTKNYARFLEERGFMTRREEEKKKIFEDVKQALAGEDKKIISDDIQKLITSNIVNDPARKLRTVLRSPSINMNIEEPNKYDEKHRQICNRILGNNFESNTLFVKIQKDNKQSNLLLKKSSSNSGSQHSILKHKNSLILDIKSPESFLAGNVNRSKAQKSFCEVLPSTLNDLAKDKEEKSINKGSDVNVPSLSMIGYELTKSQEDTDTLQDLQSNIVPVIQSNPNIATSIEDLDANPQVKAKSLNELGANSQKDLKSKFIIKKKMHRNGDVFQANLNKNKQIISSSKKSLPKHHSVSHENIPVQGLVGLSTRDLNKPNLDSVNKINELCKVAMKSTNKITGKLIKQYSKTGKEYAKLDTKVEKLKYENTIKNWEKSLQQVENTKKSSFFNDGF